MESTYKRRQIQVADNNVERTRLRYDAQMTNSELYNVIKCKFLHRDNLPWYTKSGAEI